ncbi:hypothetical protein [Microtetraspora sp. NBRC 13810]|nr:hypothetical protein [Microtetraspora sp. NBRC 13810]
MRGRLKEIAGEAAGEGDEPPERWWTTLAPPDLALVGGRIG